MTEDWPTECAFCRQITTDLCICKQVDNQGVVRTGALCRSCIRVFILDMAHADPDRFEALVAEGRAYAEGKDDPA